ncbi:hypothetical protein FEF26_13750 [Nesterenkonia salmonea]|uniref:Uncharacterized protein n=1 Tax=Nesterenkonia salmonea TaxID=1804987 RepID=A0A5R9B7P9_9MICC|nr:hypothetical protein [Nesterenkonia salmonea]TLP93256.1 hypothetical protein FEF26_13750 [Nesterenkonia salmonea]
MGSAWIGILTYLLFVGGGILIAAAVLYVVVRGAVLSALRAHDIERAHGTERRDARETPV